ncbi:MAG: polysaccharide deacetylase family protein [Bacillota bacterium]
MIVFVTSMLTGWVAPEAVLPAMAPDDVPVPPVVIAEPGTPPVEEPEEPTTPPSDKVCYLTFDDGPDGTITPAMLDILKQYDVKATFFVVGRMVEYYPAMVKRMKDEGHAIGNHTYSHNLSHKSNAKAFADDLERANRALVRAIGEPSMIIRVPGGSKPSDFVSKVLPHLKTLGYEYFDWNVDSEDAINRKQTANQMAERVIREVSKRKTAMVLMHNINTPTSLAALPAIIEGIRDMGYEFKVIDSTTKPIHF